MSKIKVSLIDDHPLVRSGLEALLQAEVDMEIVGVYANANQLIIGLKAQLPDILLLDLQMQDVSGFDLLPELKAAYPEMKIIILTSLDTAIVVKSLFNSGANGYLLKTTNQEVIAEAIREVYSGGIFMNNEVKNILSHSLLNHKTNLGFNKELSEREREILQLIYEEYTSQEIAEKIHLSARTVENYRLGLLQKLDAKNIAGLIKKAIRMGIVKA